MGFRTSDDECCRHVELSPSRSLATPRASVFTLLQVLRTSTPCLTSHSTTFLALYEAATCKGVFPSQSAVRLL